MPGAFKRSLGSGLSTTSGTTVTITTTGDIDVGDLVVVRVAADNLSATTPTFTCADGSGNTYTNLRQAAVNATAASGVAGAMFACKATAARATGSTITVTLSGAVAHKAAYAESFQYTEVTVRSTAVGATGTATGASAGASGTVNAGDLVLGMLANETRGTITGDADTLNGSWSTQVVARSATTGTDTGCVSVAGQYKIATSSGAQTYNPTAVASEWVCQCVALQASIGFGSATISDSWVCSAAGTKAPKGSATVNWANACTAAGPSSGGGGPAWTYDFTDDADGAQPATLITWGGSLPGRIESGHFMCDVDWFFTKVYDTSLPNQDDTTHLTAMELSFQRAAGGVWLIFAGNADMTSYNAIEIHQDGTWLYLFDGGGFSGAPQFPAFTLGTTYKVHVKYNEVTAAAEVFINDVSQVVGAFGGGQNKIGNRSGWHMGGNLDVWITKFYYGPQSAGVPGSGGGGGGGGSGSATVSWVAAVAAVGGTTTPGSTVLKGVGSISRANLPAELALVKVAWFYDWANYSDTDGLPPVPSTPGVEYVPQMWGDWERTYPGFDLGGPPSESIGPATVLLGFNEPNVTAQADMTVARSLALWPQMEATGLRLGSPAVSGDPGLGYGTAWLASFMSGNGGPAPKVDFICAHWYPEYDAGYSNIGDYLDYLHTTYGKPIWLTEVASLSGGQSANVSLMPTVFAALATRPWVERVAWFDLQDAGTNSYLVTATPSLTVSGVQYATYRQGALAAPKWTMVPAGTGKRTPKAATTITDTWVTAGAGKRTPKGASTTTYLEAVAAAGKRAPKGSATVNDTSVVAGTGKRTPKGVGTVNDTWNPSAFGIMPTVGMKQGSATVSYTEVVAGAGKRTPKSTVTVPYVEAVAAVGSVPPKGTATTQWNMVPAAAGKKTPKGAVTTTALQSVAATGKRTPKSAANTGYFIFLLAAQGVAPTGGVKQGTGTADTMWVPVALGKKTPKGGNAVTYVFAVVAAGKRFQKGTAATSYLDTVAAAGKRAPKATVSVNYVEAVAAVGKKVPKGVGTGPLSYTYVVAAAGVTPIVGFKQGFGTITDTWATAAVGKKTPKGSRTISNTFNPVALGKKIQKAVATIGFVYATAAAGKKAPKSIIVVYYIEVTNAAGARASKGRVDVTNNYKVAAAGVRGIVSGDVHGVWNGTDFVAMQLGNKAVIDWLMIPS